MTLNRVSPCGGSSTPSTAVTAAPSGPPCDQSIIASTAAAAPSKAASTDPSAAFRPQPVPPRKRAPRRQVSRKNTPCTRPWTTTRRRMVNERPTSRGIRSAPNRVLTRVSRLVSTTDLDLAVGGRHLVSGRRPGGWTGAHRSVRGEMTAMPPGDDASAPETSLVQRAAAVGAAIGQHDDLAVAAARQHDAREFVQPLSQSIFDAPVVLVPPKRKYAQPHARSRATPTCCLSPTAADCRTAEWSIRSMVVARVSALIKLA